jgi:hypothetical protein
MKRPRRGPEKGPKKGPEKGRGVGDMALIVTAVWVGAAVLVTAAFGVGASIGYRRGWEDHATVDAERRDTREQERVTLG